MPVFNETPSATMVFSFPTGDLAWHQIGPVERIGPQWAESAQVYQTPQLADPSWTSAGQVRERVTIGNVGQPGQGYDVGPDERGVPGSGRVQPVRSQVSASA